VSRDLFRIERRPADVAYTAAAAEPESDPALPPLPELRLVGIVNGPHPAAIIEGFPGVTEARAVRPGESVGDLLVKRVTGTWVEIVGRDSTWMLELKEPWR
jgi:hypothetical protein